MVIQLVERPFIVYLEVGQVIERAYTDSLQNSGGPSERGDTNSSGTVRVSYLGLLAGT